MNTIIATIRLLAAPLLLLSFCCLSAAADPPPLSKDWVFDSIVLNNGYTLKGLILEETGIGPRFQQVRRATGRPTICMTCVVPTNSIHHIEKLPDSERELLKNRLKELDPTGEGERRRMENLELQMCDWNGKPKAGWRYDSDYFSLISNAPEEVVRRAAVRLEQIYIAYVHFLPPRFPGGKPTAIMLYSSTEDYQRMLSDRHWALKNQAFFSPETNHIFCGSNLKELGDDLKKIRLEHQKGRADLDKREADYRRLYGNKDPELPRHLKLLEDERKKMAKADKDNEIVFDNNTKRLFRILYHESFHAYVCNFVYPPLEKGMGSLRLPGELPRWLNEGLAQIFETAIVESGELRVGHADKERLLRIKELLDKKEMMPVKELLNSGPKAFLVQHGDERLASDKAYLTSWALAAYLSFDRRLLGSPELDAFVRAANRPDHLEEAFSKLTGKKMDDFETDFRKWLKNVPTEGSLLEPIVKK